MTRRMIESSIWSNENFAALPPRGRLLLIGMINIADDQGRLKAHPIYLAKEIFPYDHIEAIDITKWLGQMQENGTIQLYTVEGKQYAQFLNWWQYQSLQFAQPSTYPRPDGWQDCLRFNSKGNQMLVCNWTTPKGERMVDTCDQDGKPFPFVMELPARQKSAETAPKAPTEVPTLVPAEVRTLVPAQVATEAPTQAPTEVPTQVRTQVTQYNLTKDQSNRIELNTTTTMRAFAKTLLLPEWNGGDGDLDALPEKQLLIAALWLWHYQKLKDKGGGYQRNEYAEAYRPSPFANVDNAVGFIRKQIEKKVSPHLRAAHRAEFDDELRKLQKEAAP